MQMQIYMKLTHDFFLLTLLCERLLRLGNVQPLINDHRYLCFTE